MGAFDFLKPAAKGAPATQIAELEASLEKLRVEQKGVQSVVESHGQKRAEMLLSDVADDAIVKLDAAADLARIRLERLELAEVELVERIDRARDKAQRDHLASDYERSALQIEAATKALEGSITQVATAFADLVKSIPSENFVETFRETHAPPFRPASPQDVARGILANALFVASPEMFEMRNQHRTSSGLGAGVEFALSVCTVRDGRMQPRCAGLGGEESKIHPAPITANTLIIAPLREKALTLRAGAAELLRAAE